MKILKVEDWTFPTILKSLIKEKNISQEELALEIGVSSVTISNWVNGQSIRRNKDEIYSKLSNFFDVDIEYLKGNQIDKRKKDRINKNVYDKWNKAVDGEALAKEVRELELYHDFTQEIFKLLNIEASLIKEENFGTEIWKIIENQKLLTIEEPIKNCLPNKIFLNFNDDNYGFEIENDEIKRIIKEIIEFSKFKFELLKKEKKENDESI